MESAQQRDHPNLAKMALDILSIPCIVADVEQLFSSVGYMINDGWNCHYINTIKALESLKS